MTSKEVALELGITRGRVGRLGREGKLNRTKKSKVWNYCRDILSAYQSSKPMKITVNMEVDVKSAIKYILTGSLMGVYPQTLALELIRQQVDRP